MRTWDTPLSRTDTYRVADPRSKSKASQYVRRILSTVAAESETEPYVQKMRVSSLPICGLLDAVQRIEKPEKQIPFSMEFYTAIGTAVHETVQQRMARSKKYGHMVFGNWLCRKTPENRGCGNLIKFCKRPASLICPACNSASLFYDELSFDLHGTSGHLDMLTVDRHGRFVAWEFKTTGERNIIDSKYLPYKKHHIQIETYCYMLKKLYGIKVAMYNITYISRNKTRDANNSADQDQFIPFAFKVTPEMLNVRRRQLLALQTQDEALKKLFSKPSVKKIRALEELRPCKSKKDYNDPTTGMKHAFFGDSQCPYFGKGLCFHSSPAVTEAGLVLRSLLGVA